MKSSRAASRYAKALLELAVEQMNIDSVQGDMNYLRQVCADSHEFELLLSSPIVKADKKIAIFEQIFEQFEEVSMSFVKLITKNGREGLFPEIATAFEALVKEHKGIVPVTLTSAVELETGVKEAIIAKIQAGVDGQLEVEEKIDKSLIGGFVVRMGDVQVDASVASQLNNLKQRLTR